MIVGGGKVMVKRGKELGGELLLMMIGEMLTWERMISKRRGKDKGC